MDSTFMVPSHVVARSVGADTVILDLESGIYFGLDPVGARIWQLIEEGKSLAGICDVMNDEYEVSRDVLERDVLELVRELADKKLVFQQKNGL
jgi:hypothetical protein